MNIGHPDRVMRNLYTFKAVCRVLILFIFISSFSCKESVENTDSVETITGQKFNNYVKDTLFLGYIYGISKKEIENSSHYKASYTFHQQSKNLKFSIDPVYNSNNTLTELQLFYKDAPGPTDFQFIRNLYGEKYKLLDKKTKSFYEEYTDGRKVSRIYWNGYRSDQFVSESQAIHFNGKESYESGSTNFYPNSCFFQLNVVNGEDVGRQPGHHVHRTSKINGQNYVFKVSLTKGKTERIEYEQDVEIYVDSTAQKKISLEYFRPVKVPGKLEVEDASIISDYKWTMEDVINSVSIDKIPEPKDAYIRITYKLYTKGHSKVEINIDSINEVGTLRNLRDI